MSNHFPQTKLHSKTNIFLTLSPLTLSPPAYLTKNVYIFTPNVLGHLLGLYYVLLTLPYTEPRTHRQTYIIMIVCYTLIYAAGMVAVMTSPEVGKPVVGSLVVVIVVFVFWSPLMGVADVVRRRDSRGMHGGLAFASAVKGVLWGVYGFAIQDYFVAIPNAIGALLSFLQIGLLLAFRRPHGKAPEHEEIVVNTTWLSSKADIEAAVNANWSSSRVNVGNWSSSRVNIGTAAGATRSSSRVYKMAGRERAKDGTEEGSEWGEDAKTVVWYDLAQNDILSCDVWLH
ncbi:hypothetical protein HK104_001132 [Borealophlyctis nickersoniae]|nr:hypothetical protein HK104_001132 [Borealophlyctis nickersoniae]